MTEDERLLRALLAGFPDRVARRREPVSSRLVLSSGTGALLGRESGVREGDLLLALEVAGGVAGVASEAIVRVASRVERAWLEGVRTEVVHRLDEGSGSVRAFAQDWYDRLLLGERPVPPDPEAAAAVLAQALERRGLGEPAERLRRRLSVAGLEAGVHAAVLAACCREVLAKGPKVRPEPARAPNQPGEPTRGATALAVDQNGDDDDFDDESDDEDDDGVRSTG